VLGMWVHAAPFRITALHWGWDKIHDLCFLCKVRLCARGAHGSPPPYPHRFAHGDCVHTVPAPVFLWSVVRSPCRAPASAVRRQDKKQLWKPVTPLSVVIHIKGHQANWHNFINVHRNLTERCDDACMEEARRAPSAARPAALPVPRTRRSIRFDFCVND
jgi:hypothetical protein